MSEGRRLRDVAGDSERRRLAMTLEVGRVREDSRLRYRD